MFMTKGYVQRNIWQEVVPWAVLPLMIKLAGATFASSQSRSMGDFLTQPGTSNVADVAYMAVLGCSLCIIMLVYARSMIHEFCQAYLVTFLLVFITLTAAWSQSPLHTLKQAFWLWISVGFTYWLMVRFTPKQQMEMLMLTGTLSAVLCILAVVFIPSAGLDALHEFSWQGVFYSKNHMGRIFLFLLTAGIHYNGKTPVERCFRLAYIFLTLFMIAMSQSVLRIPADDLKQDNEERLISNRDRVWNGSCCLCCSDSLKPRCRAIPLRSRLNFDRPHRDLEDSHVVSPKTSALRIWL